MFTWPTFGALQKLLRSCWLLQGDNNNARRARFTSLHRLCSKASKERERKKAQRCWGQIETVVEREVGREAGWSWEKPARVVSCTCMCVGLTLFWPKYSAQLPRARRAEQFSAFKTEADPIALWLPKAEQSVVSRIAVSPAKATNGGVVIVVRVFEVRSKSSGLVKLGKMFANWREKQCSLFHAQVFARFLLGKAAEKRLVRSRTRSRSLSLWHSRWHIASSVSAKIKPSSLLPLSGAATLSLRLRVPPTWANILNSNLGHQVLALIRFVRHLQSWPTLLLASQSFY